MRKEKTIIIDYCLKRVKGCEQALVKHNGNYYVVSHSTRNREPETFIFESDSNGAITNWGEVGGRKYAELDEVLADMDRYFY